ncbi:MAG: tetratricopeptide repeat protein [Ignavibacteriaceae bacterium]|nr:tetratricopeptide repeat protein [Ignavibacteriaceae bacterium]
MDSAIKLKHKIASADNFIAQGKYLHAIQLYERMLVEFPQNQEVYYNLAQLYELSGNFNSSFNLLSKYLESNPNDVDMQLYYGQLLFKHEEWERAIEVFTKLVPEEKPLSQYFLGHAYLMIRDLEMSRISFLSFISLDADRELVFEAFVRLAKIELEMKDFEQALKYAKQSEIFFSSNWELYFIYANCYLQLGMDAHAITAIEKAIKLNPQPSELYELAGKIYLRTGDNTRAESNFKKYIELNESVSSETYSQLADACFKAKKIDSALDYYELALKIDPGNKSALMGVQNIHRNKKSSVSKDA